MITTYSYDHRFQLIADRNETDEFARGWPCSKLRGGMFDATFDKRNGDLIDGLLPDEVESAEVSAFVEFALRKHGYADEFIALLAR